MKHEWQVGQVVALISYPGYKNDFPVPVQIVNVWKNGVAKICEWPRDTEHPQYRGCTFNQGGYRRGSDGYHVSRIRPLEDGETPQGLLDARAAHDAEAKAKHNAEAVARAEAIDAWWTGGGEAWWNEAIPAGALMDEPVVVVRSRCRGEETISLVHVTVDKVWQGKPEFRVEVSGLIGYRCGDRKSYNAYGKNTTAAATLRRALWEAFGDDELIS